MPVQPFNFNIADERPIELGLWDRNIPCYRCEWRSMWARLTIASDRTLLFKPPFGGEELEVAVVYYRGGYVIEEYKPNGKALRVRLEISRAIKCPDILAHLSGFKTVQQALTEPGAVERFLSSDKAERVRKTFMPMQILDTSAAGLKAREIPHPTTVAHLHPSRTMERQRRARSTRSVRRRFALGPEQF